MHKVMPPKISCIKIPLGGYRAQIWVSALNQWFDMSGCPVLETPAAALNWAVDQLMGWPE